MATLTHFDAIDRFATGCSVRRGYILEAQLTYLWIRHSCNRPTAHWDDRPTAVVLLSVDVFWCARTCFSQRTVACDNCHWTMLDFSFMYGNVLRLP